MRIAYLHYLIEDDTGRHHVRQFVQGALALGHRVDVHAMNRVRLGGGAPGRSGETAGRWPDPIRGLLQRYLHEPKELLWNAPYVWRETRILRAGRPDVMLVRDHGLTCSCLAVSRRLDLPLVLEMNAPAEEGRLYLDEYFHLPGVAAWIQGHKVRRADSVVVVSSTLKAFLVETYGAEAGKIVVAPNGADLEIFRPDAPPDPAFRPPPGSVVVGFVGSFQKWHGPDLLLRLLRDAGEARPDLRFLMVGEGPESSRLRDLAPRLGERLTFTGRVPHSRVPGLVAHMDIGVLPETLFYASPLKLIEWMAAGRAVVAPAYDAVRDVVEDGVHGLLFPVGDGAALVRAVLRLADDPGLRRRLGAAAAERARSDLSWTDNARRVVGACESAIRRRGAARAS